MLKRAAAASIGTTLVAASGSSTYLANPDELGQTGGRRGTSALPAQALFNHVVGGAPGLPPLAVVAFNRLAFGPRPEDFAHFYDLGDSDEARLLAFVEQQLDPDSIDDSRCDALIAKHDFATLDLSLAEIWRDYVQNEMDRDIERSQPAQDVEKMTFLRAVYSQRQLVEVLTDHWHNHFNIYGWDYWTAPFFAHYDQQVIRPHVLGNFRQMLEAVAQSPAMLYYLDNQSNEGGSPNENFARELFELHTMGAENYLGVRALDDPSLTDQRGRRIGYIDEDVYGATLSFTGWQINEETGLFEFEPRKHFPYQKLVLGENLSSFQGIHDGQAVLDLLAAHPGTAQHIAYKLCSRLVADRPPPSVVAAAAATFQAAIDAPDQIKQVVHTIVLSDEFKQTWGQKVKRPLEYAVSLLRAAEADFDAVDNFLRRYNDTGQRLFGWHPPNGYPDVMEAWTSTMPMLQRWRFCNEMLAWQHREGPKEGTHRLCVTEEIIAQMPESVTTPRAIVDWWSQRLMGRTLPAQEHHWVAEFMAHGRNPDFELPAEAIAARLRPMIGLIFMSPSFQWR